MNNEVAFALLDAELQRLRALSYADLANLVGENQAKEIIAADGNTYQIETDICWDNPSRGHGDIRVMVAADDGGWKAFKPFTRDFIIRPDGTFIE